MAEGDTLQIVAGHQAFAAPTGGEQTVTLLGPFHVDHTTVGLTGTGGAVVADIAAGQRVIRAWIEMGEDDPWVVEVGHSMSNMRVQLRDAAAANNNARLITYGEPETSDNFAGYFARIENSTIDAGPYVATAVVDCKLAMQVVCDHNGDDLTAGSADVYALIATPS